MTDQINIIHDSNDFFKKYKLTEILIKNSSVNKHDYNYLIKYYNNPKFLINLSTNDINIYPLNDVFLILLINKLLIEDFIKFYKEYFNSAYLKLMIQHILFTNILKENKNTTILNKEIIPSFKNLFFEDTNKISFKIFSNTLDYNNVKIYINNSKKTEITLEQFKKEYKNFKNIQISFILSDILIYEKINKINYSQDKIITEIILN